jgi:hypothetical protein
MPPITFFYTKKNPFKSQTKSRETVIHWCSMENRDRGRKKKLIARQAIQIFFDLFGTETSRI